MVTFKREIKYRIWDNVGKKFYYSDHNTGRILVLHAMENEMEGYKDPSTTLQQYTGVNDSVGKEIYEGDIVHVDNQNRKVVWRGHGFYLTWSEYGLDTCWFVGGAPVVVGNEFENPELLILK
jgi:uncharacterized phage protein (TIGR01671 family)